MLTPTRQTAVFTIDVIILVLVFVLILILVLISVLVVVGVIANKQNIMV